MSPLLNEERVQLRQWEKIGREVPQKEKDKCQKGRVGGSGEKKNNSLAVTQNASGVGKRETRERKNGGVPDHSSGKGKKGFSKRRRMVVRTCRGKKSGRRPKCGENQSQQEVTPCDTNLTDCQSTKKTKNAARKMPDPNERNIVGTPTKHTSKVKKKRKGGKKSTTPHKGEFTAYDKNNK